MNPEIYTDISVIIGMMPNEMKSKISRKLIEFIESKKSMDYVSSVNPKLPLNEQNLKEETKVLLGIIYRDYLCDEMEKNRLLEEDKKELDKIELEKKEKYNPNDLFQKETTNKLEKVQDFALIEYEESIFKRFFKKIKNILISMSNKND